jgi:hypothetical protein
LIYVFDLDNTLCNTTKKENGEWDYHNSIPFEKRIEKVNNLFEKGNIIIIETARGNSSKIDWFSHTETQLKKWGLKYNHLRTGVKFGADYYVDDKAVNSELFFGE